VHVDKNGNGKPLVDGFVTFIHVDENTKPAPHLIEVSPESSEDKELFEKARELKGR
jgi:acyl-CoA hydrolase